MALVAVLLLLVVLATSGEASAPAVAPALPLPQLFLSLGDARDPWGKIVPRASTVRRQPNVTTPATAPLAAFNVRTSNGTAAVEVFGLGPSGLWRWTTVDFLRWDSQLVLNLVKVGKHCCEAKSIARDERTGRMVFLAWQAGYGGHSFVSTDGGLHWNITAAHIKAHDDANIIYDNGRARFVDLQILKQKLPGGREKRYCDNTGCTDRRVITALVSTDGINFTTVNGSSAKNGTNVRVPDAEDPPELEFYRIRPFRLGGSDRLAAHVLLYAPSPNVLHAVNKTYGIYTLCDKHNRSWCHGPHIRDEWWTLPRGGDAAAVESWERPYRDRSTPVI
jgi:hypothetical protein